MTLNFNKWCKHCRKVDHNTSECWSTHAVDPWEASPEAPGGWLGVMKGALAAHAKVERAADAVAAPDPQPKAPSGTGGGEQR